MSCDILSMAVLNVCGFCNNFGLQNVITACDKDLLNCLSKWDIGQESSLNTEQDEYQIFRLIYSMKRVSQNVQVTERVALQPCPSYRFTFYNPPECTIFRVKLLRLLWWEGASPLPDSPPARSASPPSHDPPNSFSWFFLHPFSSLSMSVSVSLCEVLVIGRLKLNFGKYPAIHANYITPQSTTL